VIPKTTKLKQPSTNPGDLRLRGNKSTPAAEGYVVVEVVDTATSRHFARPIARGRKWLPNNLVLPGFPWVDGASQVVEGSL
jgi:hypothetical protein